MNKEGDMEEIWLEKRGGRNKIPGAVHSSVGTFRSARFTHFFNMGFVKSDGFVMPGEEEAGLGWAGLGFRLSVPSAHSPALTAWGSSLAEWQNNRNGRTGGPSVAPPGVSPTFAR